MAIGFQISGTGITTATIRPDNDLKAQHKAKIRTARFGDGYEQRSKDGINSISEIYTINMKNREKATADDIIKFFEDKAGITSFPFTIPDTNSSGDEKTVRVVCDTYSIQYVSGNYYNVNAKFKRIYGI